MDFDVHSGIELVKKIELQSVSTTFSKLKENQYFYIKIDGSKQSIANSSLFPTFMYLHSNSTQMLALKKPGFFTFSGSKN